MEYKKAATYWIEKDRKAAVMDRGELFDEIEQFICAHNTCALATGRGDFVRCTPIEYSYRDNKFWMLSEGGLKFRALEHNKNVCIAIFDEYTGFAELRGMQITGTAEIVEPCEPEYTDFLVYKNLSPENIKNLPTALNVIKVTPSRIDYLCSDFKKRGFDSRQYLCL